MKSNIDLFLSSVRRIKKMCKFLLYFSAQVIYVAHNAKDNAVSYFHFDRMNSIQPAAGDWSSYLRRFMEGKST